MINGSEIKSSCLEDISKQLLSNGLYALAIACQKKVSFQMALDTCVALNMWEEASIVADEGNLRSKLEIIVKEKIDNLLTNNEHLYALKLCQCMDLASDAATILCNIGESSKKAEYQTIPNGIAKKLFIMAAKQVERHREKSIDMSRLKLRGGEAANDIASSIGKFMDDQSHTNNENKRNVMKIFSEAWRNAAAQHYFLMAHKKLFIGKPEAAMKFAIRCCDFLDVLNSIRVYSLITLASYMSKFFEICSISLSRLMTSDEIDKATSKTIKNLVRHILRSFPPPFCVDQSFSYERSSLFFFFIFTRDLQSLPIRNR